MQRDKVRFLALVKKSEGCWLWIGAQRKGYGNFWFRGGPVSAHRVAWILTRGEIPDGEGAHGTCVLHRCDTPLCVRPSHLRLGTQFQNMRDMAEKGRKKRKPVV